MTNPYRPPSSVSNSHAEVSRQSVWACVGFAVLSSIAAWSIRDAPHITVTMIAAFGVFLFPLARPAHRQHVIWCNVAGLVLATIGPAIFVQLFIVAPNTYESGAKYSKIVETILPVSLTLSVWASSFIGVVLSRDSESINVSKTDQQ